MVLLIQGDVKPQLNLSLQERDPLNAPRKPGHFHFSYGQNLSGTQIDPFKHGNMVTCKALPLWTLPHDVIVHVNALHSI